MVPPGARHHDGGKNNLTLQSFLGKSLFIGWHQEMRLARAKR
jgi:hypothetical protein